MSVLNYPNYLVSADSKLLSQFREKPVVRGLLLSALTPLQETQQSLIDYSINNNLELAVGSLLDVIGKLVGESRGGRSDSSYRQGIFNRIVINSSEGTVNEVLEILVLLSKGGRHRVFEHHPLTSAYYTTGTASKDLAKTLTSVSPITSDSVSVYHDPLEDAFIPCELETSLGVLIDNVGNNISNNESRNIAVTYLTAIGNSDSFQAILPEQGETSNDNRIPCEMFR